MQVGKHIILQFSCTQNWSKNNQNASWGFFLSGKETFKRLGWVGLAIVLRGLVTINGTESMGCKRAAKVNVGFYFFKRRFVRLVRWGLTELN